MADRPDQDLALDAMRGDVDSFMALCHRHYPAMVAIAQAVLGDSHLAEDAAQEAFAKACRRLDSLKDPNRFGAWLTAICRNQARDIGRRIPRTQSLGDRDVPQDIPEQPPEVDAVKEAMDSLPVESRELLYLKYRNELSHQEISKLLDISPQAVHGRLKRARQAVREHLERHTERRLS